MIKSFRCRETRALFETGASRRWGAVLSVATRKLALLRSPPGNHLEALAGDRAGRFSIRINDQWRICFVWRNGHAEDVEIVDYH